MLFTPNLCCECVGFRVKKVLLSRDSPCLFPAFLFCNETFFLKLTRTAWRGFSYRNYSTVVFAFWRGLCAVKGVEWLCIQFVKCNTGVILSQSTSTWQPLCARYVLPVGWSCWLHSTRWMYHRTGHILRAICSKCMQMFAFMTINHTKHTQTCTCNFCSNSWIICSISGRY